MWFSISFVFLSLVEYAIAIAYVNTIDDRKESNIDGHRYEVRRKFSAPSITSLSSDFRRSTLNSVDHHVPDVVETKSDHRRKSQLRRFLNKLLIAFYGHRINWYKNPLQRNKIDYLARILFPLFYILLSGIYLVSFIVPWVMVKGWLSCSEDDLHGWI